MMQRQRKSVWRQYFELTEVRSRSPARRPRGIKKAYPEFSLERKYQESETQFGAPRRRPPNAHRRHGLGWTHRTFRTIRLLRILRSSGRTHVHITLWVYLSPSHRSVNVPYVPPACNGRSNTRTYRARSREHEREHIRGLF